MEKEPSKQKFMVFLGIYHELRKLQNSESVNLVSTLVTLSTRITIHDMLIVVSL